MHNILRVLALTSVLALGGCEHLADFTKGLTATVSQVEAVLPEAAGVVSKVVATTKRLCGFEPIIATVVGVLTSGANDVFDVAKMLCNALSQQPLAATKKKQLVVVHVRGVRVQGYYTPQSRVPDGRIVK